MRIFGKIGGEVCFVGGGCAGVGAGLGRRERRGLDGHFLMGASINGFSCELDVYVADRTEVGLDKFGLGWLEPKERAVSANHSILGFYELPLRGARFVMCNFRLSGENFAVWLLVIFQAFFSTDHFCMFAHRLQISH